MTQKQTKANRENAKQSTGPRTRSGKDRSSQNSIKHGLNQAIVFENDKRFMTLLRLVKEDGYAHDEAYSIVSAILDHRRVMDACDQRYHAVGEIYGRAETIMIQDLESDAELGRITIGYNDTLKIARFKARVKRTNEKLGSVLVQRVKRLAKLIRYQRRSIAQIRRITREIKNDKTNPFIFKL
jgi:hypothetical protein